MKQILTLALLSSVVLLSCNDLSEPPKAPETAQECAVSLSDTFYAQVVYISKAKKVNRLGKVVLERSLVFRNCEAVGHSTSIGAVLINGTVIDSDSILSVDLGGSIKYPQN